MLHLAAWNINYLLENSKEALVAKPTYWLEIGIKLASYDYSVRIKTGGFSSNDSKDNIFAAL